MQHISAPLMEFERLKIIKKFKTELKLSPGTGEEGTEPAAQGEDGANNYIDYK